MTRDEIIAMAREAGLNSWVIPPEYAVRQWVRFSALVAAKAAQDERAICAALCESHEWADGHPLARKIRERGQ